MVTIYTTGYYLNRLTPEFYHGSNSNWLLFAPIPVRLAKDTIFWTHHPKVPSNYKHGCLPGVPKCVCTVFCSPFLSGVPNVTKNPSAQWRHFFQKSTNPNLNTGYRNALHIRTFVDKQVVLRKIAPRYERRVTFSARELLAYETKHETIH